jgi:hypothetical protein
MVAARPFATRRWQSTNLSEILDSPAAANGEVYIGSQTDENSNAEN